VVVTLAVIVVAALAIKGGMALVARRRALASSRTGGECNC
jgi:hypothetical protein